MSSTSSHSYTAASHSYTSTFTYLHSFTLIPLYLFPLMPTFPLIHGFIPTPTCIPAPTSLNIISPLTIFIFANFKISCIQEGFLSRPFRAGENTGKLNSRNLIYRELTGFIVFSLFFFLIVSVLPASPIFREIHVFSVTILFGFSSKWSSVRTSKRRGIWKLCGWGSWSLEQDSLTIACSSLSSHDDSHDDPHDDPLEPQNMD
jgi:hypothetical protein